MFMKLQMQIVLVILLTIQVYVYMFIFASTGKTFKTFIGWYLPGEDKKGLLNKAVRAEHMF